MGIELTSETKQEKCKEHPKKDCGAKHTQRVANATLEIAIDVHTDFDCKPEK